MPKESGQTDSGPFIDAAMATSALVATADGALDFAKRHKVDEFLENLADFASFNFHAALVLFEAFAEEIHSRPEQGRARALRALRAVADNREEARILVRIACAVAREEGRYSPAAIARIGEVARVLGQRTPDLETQSPDAAGKRPLCIAIGNQKGGTGKSTTTVHLASGLLARGKRVGCLDLDGDQGTLSHYLANRIAYARKTGEDIPMPLFRSIEPSKLRNLDEAEDEERQLLNEAFAAFPEIDYLIVDTPGNLGHLSRLGHINADVLITPLNDSFLDVDVLAQIDVDRRLVLGPSDYARMVLQQNEHRVASGWEPIDWIVMRNRLSQLDTRNSRDISKLLGQLSERMGFRLHPGLSERVVFRELFFNGLTLQDLPEDDNEARVAPRRWNARQEVRQLLEEVLACRRSGRKPDMVLDSVFPGSNGAAEAHDEEEEVQDPFVMLKQAMSGPAGGGAPKSQERS